MFRMQCLSMFVARSQQKRSWAAVLSPAFCNPPTSLNLSLFSSRFSKPRYSSSLWQSPSWFYSSSTLSFSPLYSSSSSSSSFSSSSYFYSLFSFSAPNVLSIFSSTYAQSESEYQPLSRFWQHPELSFIGWIFSSSKQPRQKRSNQLVGNIMPAVASQVDSQVVVYSNSALCHH